MEQSIASSPVNIETGESQGTDWKVILAGLWSTLLAAGSRIAPGNWLFRRRVVTDMSKPLNVDALSSRLAVGRRGQMDGSSELPLSSEEVISGTQREIVVHFKQLQRQAQRPMHDVADKLRRLGEKLDLAEVSGRLRDIPSRCENAVLRFTAEFQSRLDAMAERERQLQQRYKKVCTSDDSSHKDNSNISLLPRFTFLAFLIAMAALGLSRISAASIGAEALLAPAIATWISLLAVLVPAAMAIGVVWSIYKDGQLRRLNGWLIATITIALIVTLAVCTAYYIVAIIANPELTVRNVLDAILVDAGRIGSHVIAWIGEVSAFLSPATSLAVVIVAGLLALMSSYRSDAQQSSAASLSRAINRTQRKRDRLTRKLRKRINAIVDQAESDVNEVQLRLKSRARQCSRLLQESKQMPTRLRDYDVALEDACNIVLDRYRAANVRARRTGVPVSFSEHISFRQEHAFDNTISRDAELQLEKLQAGLAELDSETAKVRQKLRDMNWTAIVSLEQGPATA